MKKIKLKDIKPGQILKVVGKKGGCTSTSKCYKCSAFKEKVKIIKVIRISEGRGRTVNGEDFYCKKTACFFLPEDLKPLTWKERYKKW